jgi:transposase
MGKGITWVGLDTSKKKHAVAILDPEAREARELSIPNEPRAIARFARKLVREAPGEVRVCYEAGPCGYALMRQMEKAAALVCEVVAPALIPVRRGERIKTDRRDAVKLARLYRSGELTPVHPPTGAEESVRDLMRCREDAKEDLMRARHRLSKFLLRQGLVYTGGATWTVRHEQWLSSVSWEHPAHEEVFEDYRLAISHLGARIQALDARIEEISQQPPYQEPVGWLRCFRGIDTATAMTILTEIHDFRRFESAPELMSYLGMVSSEHSSGEQTRRGRITKAGNNHARRILVEAAHHSRHRPAVGRGLRKRREGQPAWVIERADKAMQRLWERYRRLRLARGKQNNKVVVAMARELAGFVWAVMREGSSRQQQKETARKKLHGRSRRVA